MGKIKLGLLVLAISMMGVVALPATTFATDGVSGGVGDSGFEDVSDEAVEATKNAAIKAANEFKAECLEELAWMVPHYGQSAVDDACSDQAGIYLAQMWEYLAVSYARAMGENVQPVAQPSKGHHLWKARQTVHPDPPTNDDVAPGNC